MNLAFSQSFFNLPTKVEYGPGVHKKVGGILKTLGCRKAMLVTSPDLIQAGIVRKITDVMTENDLLMEICDNVTSEPTDTIVHEGARRLKETQCDVIIGLGGGSAMDSAKCIAVMAENSGSIADYEGVEANFRNNGKVPIITMPTTSGSGAEIAGWAVVTDTSRDYKMSLGSAHLTPEYAIVDPELTLALPPRQTAYSGFDALSQAIEGMLSRRRTPVTIAIGMHAVKLIAENLPRAIARGWDMEARSNMSIGSFLAGIAIDVSGCIAVHTLAEIMGGMYHQPHGLMVALCLPHILRYNLPGDYELMAQIASALGVPTQGMSTRDAAEAAVTRVNQMLDDLNFPLLGDIGLTESDIPQIAGLAVAHACTPDNPRDLSAGDFETVLRDALQENR